MNMAHSHLLMDNIMRLYKMRKAIADPEEEHREPLPIPAPAPSVRTACSKARPKPVNPEEGD